MKTLHGHFIESRRVTSYIHPEYILLLCSTKSSKNLANKSLSKSFVLTKHRKFTINHTMKLTTVN